VGDSEEAFGFKERMKEQNVETDLVKSNCMLNGLCGSERVEDVREVLLEMEGDGFLSGGFLSDVFGNHSSDDDSFDGK